ncbi:hypothetical protein [Nostoc sp.]|uniref:hypothetical protein n=1 Tax=Nostoc sp. TaxID=1180 RepID=UPI002FF796F0
MSTPQENLLQHFKLATPVGWVNFCRSNKGASRYNKRAGRCNKRASQYNKGAGRCIKGASRYNKRAGRCIKGADQETCVYTVAL